MTTKIADRIDARRQIVIEDVARLEGQLHVLENTGRIHTTYMGLSAQYEHMIANLKELRIIYDAMSMIDQNITELSAEVSNIKSNVNQLFRAATTEPSETLLTQARKEWRKDIKNGIKKALK